MKPKALYYHIMQYQPVNYQYLRTVFDLHELNNPAEDTSELLENIEVLFAPLGFQVDDEKMAHCTKLRVIVSNTTGIPHISVHAARQRGIKICALHDEQAFLQIITSTAEHTIGLIIAVWRRVLPAHQSVLNGQWSRNDWVAPKMLSRMCLGIVGYGRLGQIVAHVAKAMGMTVVYYDPYVKGGEVSLKELVRKAEILSLHAPSNQETYQLISREILESLPKGAIVINTARGELIDFNALLELLESKHLAGAGIDTITGEYSLNFQHTDIFNKAINYARTHDNLLLTPHIGGSTSDARIETERFVINKACKVLQELVTE